MPVMHVDTVQPSVPVESVHETPETAVWSVPEESLISDSTTACGVEKAGY